MHIQEALVPALAAIVYCIWHQREGIYIYIYGHLYFVFAVGLDTGTHHGKVLIYEPGLARPGQARPGLAWPGQVIIIIINLSVVTLSLVISL